MEYGFFITRQLVKEAFCETKKIIKKLLRESEMQNENFLFVLVKPITTICVFFLQEFLTEHEEDISSSPVVDLKVPLPYHTELQKTFFQ